MGPRPRQYTNEPIAVIGSGLRFPGGADTPHKLWELLREPHDVQSAIPPNRFNPNGFSRSTSETHGNGDTLYGHFLHGDCRDFDAQFFGIKPVEANALDPQHRLLLEIVYETVEAAGMTMENLRGSATSVYVGLMASDYADLLNRDTSYYPLYGAAGTARSMISNRISHFYDWRGPSMTIDTACSSSLVALHQAVHSLRRGESQIAVAAGANLILGPEVFVAGGNMNMLSPDGRSYHCDARAQGYGRGEGVAAVLLKTMSSAIADGDDIECLIIETGVNQDGRTNGLTVPSAAAQAALIAATYSRAGLDPNIPSDRPQYFEAHGTGTPIGDSIEAEAIHNVFFKDTECHASVEPLYVGSIKTVIGHTEGTAGLAGLIKTSLALKHGIIPPNLLFENLALGVIPYYDQLEIATKAKPWPTLLNGSPRRASVNSFGFGGTNAHCILENYMPEPTTSEELVPIHTPFVFSAASQDALFAIVALYSRYLKNHLSLDLGALSYTLSSRRQHFDFRVTVTSQGIEELCAKLDALADVVNKPPMTSLPSIASPRRILGIFTGQGAQWAGMASKLMKIPEASRVIDGLENSLSRLADPPSWSLRAELSAPKSCSRVMEADIAQPACTAIQILLVDMLRAAGIEFSAVVGHSSGEIGAAYAAGYLSAFDAIRIAYYRGVHLQLVQGTNGQAGSMLAVGATYQEAEAICNSPKFCGRICVAASNSATSVTLSGDMEAIEAVMMMFQEKQRFARLLRVDNACKFTLDLYIDSSSSPQDHSHHMIKCSEAITASLRACRIEAYRPLRPVCSWISSVYHQDISIVEDDLNDVYWHSNTVGPVLFSQALEYALMGMTFDLAVEVGAHPALKGPASQVVEDTIGHTIPYTGLLSRGADDINAFADGLGYIWAKNIPVDFTEFSRFCSGPKSPRLLKDLPKYPWEHQRAYWHESRISKSFRHRGLPHELLGSKRHNYSSDQVSWSNHMTLKELSWIAEHRIQGQIVFPAAGYISSAIEAAQHLVSDQKIRLIELKKFVFGHALIFDSEETRVETSICLTEIDRQGSRMSAKFSYYSIDDRKLGPMSLNASGWLCVTLGEPDASASQSFPQPLFGMNKISSEDIYSSLSSYGYEYHGRFKALESVERRSGVATGLVRIPKDGSVRRLLIHPAVIDAAMHSIMVAYCHPGDGRIQSIQLPVDVESIIINPIHVSDACGIKFVSHSRDDGMQAGGDVYLYPTGGSNAMLQLEGVRTKPMIPPTADTDIRMFSETVWGSALPIATVLSDQSGVDVLESKGALHELKNFIEQVTHRHPAMQILQLGTCVNKTTETILTALDSRLASYTIANTNPTESVRLNEDITACHAIVRYSTLDLDRDTVSQGFPKYSSDVVITHFDPYAPTKSEYQVEKARTLLKPGGYLLIIGADGCERLGSLTSSFMNSSGDISDSPTGLSTPLYLEQPSVSSVSSQLILKATYPDLLIAQAIDDRIRILQDPLVFFKRHHLLPRITVIGGATRATSSCLSELETILINHGSTLVKTQSLEDLSEADILLGGVAIVMQDHDETVYDKLDEKKLKGIQTLFGKSRTVLWITHGVKLGVPHARMAVGFMRCLLQEMSHVRLQVLDLPAASDLKADMILPYLLRLFIVNEWEEQGHLDNILWTLEPEVSRVNGKDLIPRVKPLKTFNNRYNCARRSITEFIDPTVAPVTLSFNHGNYTLIAKYGHSPIRPVKKTGYTTIHVSHSTLPLLQIGACGSFFVVSGTNKTTGRRVLALSSSVSSELDVPDELVRCHCFPEDDNAQQLNALFWKFAASVALRNLDRGDWVAVLEPGPALAELIKTLATPRGINFRFLTSSGTTGKSHPWTYLPIYPSRREVDAALPAQFSHLVYWQEDEWTARIRGHARNGIRFTGLSPCMTNKPIRDGYDALQVVSDFFDLVLHQSSSTMYASSSADVRLLPLARLHGLRHDKSVVSIVEWTDNAKVPVQVQAIDSQVLFREDKTYWLVGLTGGLGLSLCEWMISRGARHIAISSRKPTVDPRWTTYFGSLHATVKIFPADIADPGSVRSCYDRILAEMPAVIGICHGAMVLQDTLVSDLDMPGIKMVLKPKVDGALNLDKLFQKDDLDFFIMLSSIAAIVGNPGQAAYAAANGCLAGIAAQRRARGVAASTVNLGAIKGNGYISREFAKTQQENLQKSGIMWTSEQDFHQAFAEAVVASPALSGSVAEFCTGIRIPLAEEQVTSGHASNAIFSHLVLHRTIPSLVSGRAERLLTLKAQLLQASSPEETQMMLRMFVSAKVRKALQISEDTEIIEKTAESLGIDSLIAIELRSWFLKEFNIEMPVLKIIGGDTMLGLVETAYEQIRPLLTIALGKRSSVDKNVAPDTNEQNRLDPSNQTEGRLQKTRVHEPLLSASLGISTALASHENKDGTSELVHSAAVNSTPPKLVHKQFDPEKRTAAPGVIESASFDTGSTSTSAVLLHDQSFNGKIEPIPLVSVKEGTPRSRTLNLSCEQSFPDDAKAGLAATINMRGLRTRNEPAKSQTDWSRRIRWPKRLKTFFSR